MPPDVYKPFLEKLSNSFMNELDEDPESQLPNSTTRPIKTGHYVRVVPEPLSKPVLVSYSQDLVKKLGLESVCETDLFPKLFSGDVKEANLKCWSTPYAVSVYGQPIPAPDHFNGYAYGDGRACSLGQFKIDSNHELELQLKGSGPTPFSRMFDGRAVLRSSIREFLVSEAMHALGVPTTRALSIVLSIEDKVPRAWYNTKIQNHSNAHLTGRKYAPNMMIEENCAITCRASSSFLRVGQVELFYRRFVNGDPGAKEGFHKFINHVIRREFQDISEIPDFSKKLISMLQIFSARQAKLVANWIRVGYVQGNMNSDNCLLNGCTMDYGPFGFLSKYNPLWTPFTSDPEANFGFERQPRAAHVNVATLMEALVPFVDSDDVESLENVIKVDFPTHFMHERNEMRRSKLGLSTWFQNLDSELWDPVYSVLDGFDYTIFWRELSTITDEFMKTATDDEIVNLFTKADYGNADYKGLCEWIKKWFAISQADVFVESERMYLMKKSNPKYIPREWMLIEAYELAQKGDFSLVKELEHVLWSPYDEHTDYAEKYYCKTPLHYLSKPGSAFYS